MPGTYPSAYLTLVFTDIVSSSSLSQQYGDLYLLAQEEHDTILRDNLARWSGTEIKNLGDGLMLTFPHPEQAIQWAMETQCALQQKKWPPGLTLDVRIGIRWGRPRLKPTPDGSLDYCGSEVNATQRICALAEGGHILVSQATYNLARHDLPGEFTWEDLGEQELRGNGKDHLWRVSHPAISAIRPSPAPVPSAPPPPASRDAAQADLVLPYRRNPHFVGRARVMKMLDANLRAPDPQPVALIGMGGLGKTQLAVEYAHAHIADYTRGVFWLNARDAQRLRDDYIALGRFFDISDKLEKDDGLERVREALQRLEQPALLVLDNVTETTDLSLLPAVGKLSILMTTQRKKLPENYCIVEPPRLDERAALRLLQSHYRARGTAEKAAARDIVRTLGCLPLALALAAHHVKALGGGYIEYRRRLAENPHLTLLKARERFKAVTEHDGSLYDTIDLAFQSLTRQAVSVLAVAACFAPRDISADLLFKASGLASRNDYSEAVAELWNCSLLDYETETEETGRRVALHELVSEFARARLPVQQCRDALRRVVRVLTACLHRANQALEWKATSHEIAHCYAAARLCRARATLPEFEGLLREMGSYHCENRNLPAALAHFEEGEPLAAKRHGADSLERAQFLRLIAEVEQDLGNTRDALRHARSAHRLARALMPSDAPDMADFFTCLGYVLKRQNYLQRAMPYYRCALHISETRYGSDHPAVAACLNNIGAAYEAIGDRKREYATKAQQEASQDMPSDSENTLVAAQEDWKEARRYFERALAIDERHYGPNHRNVAAFLNNIGRILGKQGEWHEAMRCHVRAQDIYMRVYEDARHPDVGASFYYIAEVHRGLNRREDATLFYKEALEILERAYGSEHNSSVWVRSRRDSL